MLSIFTYNHFNLSVLCLVTIMTKWLMCCLLCQVYYPPNATMKSCLCHVRVNTLVLCSIGHERWQHTQVVFILILYDVIITTKSFRNFITKHSVKWLRCIHNILKVVNIWLKLHVFFLHYMTVYTQTVCSLYRVLKWRDDERV